MTAYDIGEVAPSAGLAPRARDLIVRRHDDMLEIAICSLLDLPDIEIVGTGTVAIFIALSYLKRQAPQRRKVIISAYMCPLAVSAISAAGLQTFACDTVDGGFDLDAE